MFGTFSANYSQSVYDRVLKTFDRNKLKMITASPIDVIKNVASCFSIRIDQVRALVLVKLRPKKSGAMKLNLSRSEVDLVGILFKSWEKLKFLFPVFSHFELCFRTFNVMLYHCGWLPVLEGFVEYTLFLEATLFFNSASVLLNFFMNSTSDGA